MNSSTTWNHHFLEMQFWIHLHQHSSPWLWRWRRVFEKVHWLYLDMKWNCTKTFNCNCRNYCPNMWCFNLTQYGKHEFLLNENIQKTNKNIPLVKLSEVVPRSINSLTIVHIQLYVLQNFCLKFPATTTKESKWSQPVKSVVKNALHL